MHLPVALALAIALTTVEGAPPDPAASQPTDADRAASEAAAAAAAANQAERMPSDDPPVAPADPEAVSAPHPIYVVAEPEHLEQLVLARASMIAEDVHPTVDVYETRRFRLMLGGLLQVWAAPLATQRANPAAGDRVAKPGFRLRRGWVALDVGVGRDFGAYFGIDLLQELGAGLLPDAKLRYVAADWFQVSVGSGKIAFSRSALESSSRLWLADRPISVRAAAEQRRLGATVEGAAWRGRLAWAAGVYNGSPGGFTGNLGGYLASARIELAPRGAILEPHRIDAPAAIAFGAAGLVQNSPALPALVRPLPRAMASLDVLATYRALSLQLEALCAGASARTCGGYAQGGYAFLVARHHAQLVARGELLGLDFGVPPVAGPLMGLRVGPAAGALTQWAAAGGLNTWLFDEVLKAQLEYHLRKDRAPGVYAHTAIVALQAAF